MSTVEKVGGLGDGTSHQSEPMISQQNGPLSLISCNRVRVPVLVLSNVDPDPLSGSIWAFHISNFALDGSSSHFIGGLGAPYKNTIRTLAVVSIYPQWDPHAQDSITERQTQQLYKEKVPLILSHGSA